MFNEPFFGMKSGSEKGSIFKACFFRELLSKIAKLPPVLLDNPILHKHKRKECIVLSQQFMVNCCLHIPQRDRNENNIINGTVIACLVLSIIALF